MGFIETVRHLFTPHTTNNHRARLLHSSSLFFYILFVVFVQLSLQTIHVYQPAILGYATDIRVEKVLQYTNQQRTKRGLSPLVLSKQLSQAAYAKAIDMFNNNYWAHTSPQGMTPWRFMLKAGYHYLVAGENLAKNFNDSRSVVEAWMDSPSHRDNLLKSEYQDIGLAVVDGKLQGEETTLVVQMFGTRKGSQLSRIPEVQATAEKMPVLPVVAGSEQATTTRATKILPYELAGVRNKPLLDIRSLQRELTVLMLLFLIGVLLIDGYFVYIDRKIRLVGRNWAHIIFLLTLLGIIYFVKAGAIL